MPKFLESKGLTYHLDQIIKNAKESVFLISPFLCIPESLITSINSALRRNVEVTIIYGIRDQFKNYEQDRLDRLEPKFNLFFHPRLHAKAYFNEKEALVTSLNLSDAAEDNSSKEFGVYFTKLESKEMYESLIQETTEIMNESGVPTEEDMGFCIRCDRSINLDPNKPLCIECHKIWKQYSRANYPEKFCHFCGKEANTSLNNPICEYH
jgi:phosphatidylserine/phosphatidylglycerophosphate/cardiolipin synthase-like enzyme